VACLLEKHGVDKYESELIKVAEELSAPEVSICKVANSYTQRNGDIRNPKKAITWYLQAADMGYTGSNLTLGDIFKYGDGQTAASLSFP